MRTTTILALLGGVLLSVAQGCGGDIPPPKALVDARTDYAKAKGGVALQVDPTDVHEADLALQRAEAAWRDSQDVKDEHTIDLAIIAQRKAQIAMAEAAASKAQQEAQQAKADLEAAMASQLQATRGELGKTQQNLQQTQSQLQQTAAMNEEQKKKLADLEAKLKDARDTIAKIAAVKDDDRGMVITLQGEVLFKTGKWDLKPAAMAKLDQIADALRGKEQPMVVFGYTDNVGAIDMNMDLSQKRAQSVRDYLVTKGIPSDLITSQGKGPAEPVAGNDSIEGRAQNRRVEIVVKPKKS
ncbi:MAG TPA: OmpA family protein [Polyangiaceae bacterium]|jgi:outer membrane protein OmpA-like peptidoglycan-associated protein